MFFRHSQLAGMRDGCESYLNCTEQQRSHPVPACAVWNINYVHHQKDIPFSRQHGQLVCLPDPAAFSRFPPQPFVCSDNSKSTSAFTWEDSCLKKEPMELLPPLTVEHILTSAYHLGSIFQAPFHFHHGLCVIAHLWTQLRVTVIFAANARHIIYPVVP